MIIKNKEKNIELRNIENLSNLEIVNSSSDDVAVIFCSVATTSLNHNVGDLLRINLKLCYVNKDGKFSKSRKTVSFFEDPKRELTAEESKYLDFSIKDEVGSSIDWSLVSNLLKSADLVISHNASFVKPWIEKHIGTIDTLWGCSMEQVSWTDLDFPARGLSVLSVFSGFFYDFKNSAVVLDALVYVLDLNNVTKKLLLHAKTPDLQIFAANSPRDSNHLLKERRYRWNPDVGCWWLALKDTEQGKVESEWLVDNLPGVEPQIFEIDPKFRFSR